MERGRQTTLWYYDPVTLIGSGRLMRRTSCGTPSTRNSQSCAQPASQSPVAWPLVTKSQPTPRVGRPGPFNNWKSRTRAGGTNRSTNSLAIPLRGSLGPRRPCHLPGSGGTGSPQFHDKNSTASACSRGPFQRENGHPSDPSHTAYGLGRASPRRKRRFRVCSSRSSYTISR